MAKCEKSEAPQNLKITCLFLQIIYNYYLKTYITFKWICLGHAIAFEWPIEVRILTCKILIITFFGFSKQICFFCVCVLWVIVALPTHKGWLMIRATMKPFSCFPESSDVCTSGGGSNAKATLVLSLPTSSTRTADNPSERKRNC